MKQLQHPSALSMFDKIVEASKGKKIVMFLDYDGTLSPIVKNPERAFMSDAVGFGLFFFFFCSLFVEENSRVKILEQPN